MKRRGVVVVTGGSRGIGAAICRLAAVEGWGVCFNWVEHKAQADALVGEIAAVCGQACAVQADVAWPGAAELVFEQAQRALGPVTALVNNAGITGPIGAFDATSLETMRRVLDVNVLGTMQFCQQAIRRWRETGNPGSIVNVSSTAATLGSPGEYVHYAASKAAVDALTIGLAREYAGTGIRVNAVAPGTTLTDIHAAAGEPDRPARLSPRIPMQRPGTPEEIAPAVLWMLGESASYVTGSILRVSGGL